MGAKVSEFAERRQVLLLAWYALHWLRVVDTGEAARRVSIKALPGSKLGAAALLRRAHAVIALMPVRTNGE